MVIALSTDPSATADDKPHHEPLAQRLGIRDGMALCTMGAPAGLLSWLHPLPTGVHFVRCAAAGAHLVLFFTDSSAELGRQLPRLGASLLPQAAVWVCWPHIDTRSSGDVYHRLINCMALPAGLLETDHYRLHTRWSGVKLALRQAPQRARRS